MGPRTPKMTHFGPILDPFLDPFWDPSQTPIWHPGQIWTIPRGRHQGIPGTPGYHGSEGLWNRPQKGSILGSLAVQTPKNGYFGVQTDRKCRIRQYS